MAFTIEVRWYFSSSETPGLLEQLLADLDVTGEITRDDDEFFIALRCDDEGAVLALLRSLSVSRADIEGGDGDPIDLSNGFDFEYQLVPDPDGPFEWVLEAVFVDGEMSTNDWPLIFQVASGLARRAGGIHHDDLSSEDLVAVQTMWSPPPPIKRTR